MDDDINCFIFYSIESDENMQAMRESYNNTMNHLNQELLAMKETCDQLNTERQTLIGELQQRTTELNFEQARQSSRTFDC